MIRADPTDNPPHSTSADLPRGLSFARSLMLIVVMVTCNIIGGCATTTSTSHPANGADNAAVDERTLRVDELAPQVVAEVPIFDGRTGSSLSWQDLVNRAAAAEVVIIGEIHDDARGHAVQYALLRDLLETAPGTTALAMEMLERDEQTLVDDYLDAIIDQQEFIKSTFSESWAGDGSWDRWYQPMIDLAREHDAPVIAANSPRRYVRLARTDGYDRLRHLDAPRRALFDIPVQLAEGLYRDRFWRIMSGNDPDDLAPGLTDVANNADSVVDDNGDDDIPAVDDPHLLSVFRSQMTWDATMAASVVNALEGPEQQQQHAATSRTADRAVLLIGQFHADFRGGVVQEIERRAPHLRVLTVSLQPVYENSMRPVDRERADVIIYTGRADEGPE